jgi:oligopeptide transport system substrate-binding protein
MFRSTTFLIFSALSMIVLLACAQQADARQARADFVFINRGEVGTLDPNRMSWLQDIRIGYGLWEGLYSMNPATLEPIPGAAERVEISDDKTVYTFYLRPQAKWSNGDRVTSGDFVFAWRRMLQEPGDYTYLLHYIKGAKEHEAAYGKDVKSADFETVGIKALDDLTLEVRLNHPVSFFPDLCAFPPYFPLHEKSMEKFKEVNPSTGKVSYRDDFTLPPGLVTNGAFKLVKWQLKVGIRLEKNEHYWDKANVRSSSVESLSVDDPLLAFQRYEAGDVDWLSEVTGEIGAELREAGREDYHIFPSFGTYFYTINCKPELPGGRKNPFADVRVRQAFAMAIDKQPIVDNITRLGEQITSNYVPAESFEGYPKPEGLPFDLGRAKKLLGEAGYPNGIGFPKLRLLYNTEFAQHGLIAQSVAKQIKSNLGVDLELEGVEIKQFQERLHGKQYDIARASWYGDYHDLTTFTDKYLTDGGNNDSAWSNARYDKLCADANYEIDPVKRMKMLAEAEAILLDEVPIIPLYHYVNSWAHAENVKGVYRNSRNVTLLKHVYVER